MVIKVLGLNNVFYGSSVSNTANVSIPNNQTFKGSEIQNHTVSNFVQVNTQSTIIKPKIAQKYKKMGTDKLSNGIELHSYKLSNGYKVTVVPIEGSPAVVKTYVNVGSMNETPDIKGISHFLEHMAFNGTNGENGHIKLETGDSFKKIDEIGGWANATTNYAITDYVNSSPLLNKGDIEQQIKVLAAMAEDLKLSDDMIAKEKGPVSSEINMILDNPKTIAMDQTVRTLFNVSSPADELVGGSVKHIQNLTRKNVVDYYNKYYTPNNTNIVITGDVNPDEVINLVAKNFTSTKTSVGKKYEEKLIPIQNTIRKDYISDKATSAEIMLGFAGPKNCDSKEKILYSIAVNYLCSNSSNINKSLNELNAHMSINSDKISTNPNSPRLSVIEIDSSEENSEKVLYKLYECINNLKPITGKELNRIKDSLLESKEKMFEYSDSVNDAVGHAVLDGDLGYVTKYNEILSDITIDDVNKAIAKYFDLNKTAITVIHPQNNVNSSVSFKGNTNRKPINMDHVECLTLNNNFDIGFYKNKTNNFVMNVSLNTDVPYNKKPAVRDILDEIYMMGTLDKTEDELNQYLEENNIYLSQSAGASGISVSVESNSKNTQKSLDIAKEILYRPRINEENLEKAKEKVKDRLLRQEDTAWNLYNDYKSQFDSYAFSTKEKLDAIDSITIDDVKDFYNYVQNNSRGIVTSNLPESKLDVTKEKVLNFANSLHNVRENKIKILDLYNPQDNAVVLTKAKNTNQADISEIYTFKCDNSLKENVTGALMRSILSGSSIGLFDNLREKQNLAYSVFAHLSKDEDRGELSLNILTTTDNKSTGEKSYENVQKSIEGFHNQINELIAGNFTDKDLENAKLIFKAMLLDNEGTNTKVGIVNSGLNSIHGIDRDNKTFQMVDSITRDDIVNMAKKVFSSKPVYSIVATQETLNANKEYLDKLAV